MCLSTIPYIAYSTFSVLNSQGGQYLRLHPEKCQEIKVYQYEKEIAYRYVYR